MDIRSVAASLFNPQFNGRTLAAFLKRHGIEYLHFAEEFGARHENPKVQDADGRVDFLKVQKTEAFKNGVARLDAGLEKGFRPALMCSESEPLECHRFSMVSVFLAQAGFEILHILKDKTFLTQAEMELELLEKYKKKLPQPSLFEPEIDAAAQLKFAYKLVNQEIGWKKNEPKND